MSELAVSVENLGKKYVLRHQQEGRRYKTLRDVLTAQCQRLLPGRSQTSSPGAPPSKEEFWALKDVSFEIRQGESVGIIGRNGAGKSTLLKLLSRITEPTKGRIEIAGRVASLLEVGTGFHPELTGRENIYLNGAVLGMHRSEIRQKFDEIVAFAEVEKFLDTPVKRYSSGMYMRLAFAVAAHLEPDILVVDEVLAVGDSEFQKKCLGKMGDVSKAGRTILFVSHNMAAIEQLTKKCVLLNRGETEFFGPTVEAVSQYLRASESEQETPISQWKERSGSGGARIVEFELLDANCDNRQTFRPTETIVFRITVAFDEPLLSDLAVVLESENEQPLFCTHLSDYLPSTKMDGCAIFQFEMNPNPLRGGFYKVSIALFRPDSSSHYDVILHYPAFQIEGDGTLWSVPNDARWGHLYFPFKWKVITKKH